MYKVIRLDAKSVQDSGHFEGWAARYGEPDLVGDILQPGAFADSIKRHAERGTRPAMLLHHDQRMSIGVWDSLEERAEGLYAKGRINLDDAAGREALAMLKAGTLTGLSVGFRVERAEDAHDGTRLVYAGELAEVSLVSVPAAMSARVLAVKSAIQDGDLPTARQFEHALRDLGLSRKQAQTVITEGFRALVPGDDAVSDTTLSAARAVLDNLKSINGGNPK